MEKIKDFKEVSERIREAIAICHSKSKVLNARGIVKMILNHVDPDDYDPEMLMEKAVAAELRTVLNQQGAYSFKRGEAIYVYAIEASSIEVLRQLAKNQGASMDSNSATIKMFQDIANKNFDRQLVYVFGESGEPILGMEYGMESVLDDLKMEAYPPVEIKGKD